MNGREQARVEKFGNVFGRLVSSILVSANGDLTPLDAAVLDLSAATEEIFERIVPALSSMTERRRFELPEFLGLITDLQVEFEHIRRHVEEGIPVLEDLIERFSKMEADTDPRPSG